MRALKTAMLWSVTLLAVLLVASPALATMVQYNGAGPYEIQDVSIPTIPYSGGVEAGMYNLTVMEGSLAGPYKGYCVDPAYSFKENQSYEADILPVTAASRYAEAAYILGAYYNQTKANANMAAKVQLAIWEMVFDNNAADSYDLTAGNFSTGAYNADVYNLINEAVDKVNKGFTPVGYYVAAAPQGGSNYGVYPQDFIFQKVSEPGILLLLGTGMLGLALAGRKRQVKG